MLDFMRIACAVPAVQVGNIEKNVQDICRFIAEADEKKVDLIVFPELSITGYSCGDLFFQDTMLRRERKGLERIVKCSGEHPEITVVVGTTATQRGQLYNCAAVICGGKITGVVPKTYLVEDEGRWFTPGTYAREGVEEFAGAGQQAFAPFGRGLTFSIGGEVDLGVEVCADLWSPVPESSLLALKGAEVIVNLSASPEVVGKRKIRRDMILQQSRNAECVYAFVSAGYTESTQDVVYGGHSMIAVCGESVGENKNLVDTDYMMIHDVDLGIVRARRRRNQKMKDAAKLYEEQADFGDGYCETKLRSDGSLLKLNKLPFIPETAADRKQYCMDVFQIQVSGLKRRLMAVGTNAVIGVSGGLDSTLALLVAAEAMRQLGRPASDVYGVTMPCFGTSDRTYNNSLELMEKLGVRSKEVNIRDAVTLHFRDIGHDMENRNATYENAQARERTQILMDYAGEVGGIVVGTGDLSELALGWCTYNGDHMSMYSVNGSVPKTLIRWMIEAIAEQPEFVAAKDVLTDILDTPISPELLPPDAEGKIAQQTEDIVGPYALHDFYLYHLLHYGYGPKKIYALACRAFEKDFTPEIIKKWLNNFFRRFFTQQFKRNCQPDGVKALPVSLGPRGDWKMPSDASYRVWMEEMETM